MTHWYVGYKSDGETDYRPKHIYSDKSDPKSKIKEVFWGDYLVVTDESDADWLNVNWGGKPAFFKKTDAVHSRPLEIVFVDVGQGDGAVLITPERDDGEAIIVIDAGKDDMMANFLNGRFGKYLQNMDFHAAIMTHCDEDHYGGFRDLVGLAGFEKVYHNGLVERASSFEDANGQRISRKKNDRLGTLKSAGYADFPETHTAFKAAFSDKKPGGDFATFAADMLKDTRWGGTKFLGRKGPPTAMNQAWLPGFAPADGREYTIEVLGPIVTTQPDGTKTLPRFDSNYGKTKNGNSILLRLAYGNFSVFFGGDLNRPAEEYLLAQYAGRDNFPELDVRGGPIRTLEALVAEIEAVSQTASPHFSSSVMKTCHHGSADVTDAFIQAVDPAAFVISSGETGGYVHPRPDLLGRLGKLGAGLAPVILSTELQRGSRQDDDFKDAKALRKKLANFTPSANGDLPEDIDRLITRLARSNVQVYGAIYLKTDGDRLVTAFKKENDNPKSRWFHFEYKVTEHGLMAMASGSH